MKAFRVIFLLVFVSGMLFSFSVKAQAEKKVNPKFTLTLTNGETKYYLTGVEIITISASGNLTRIVTFKVDPSNEIMKLANPVAFFRVTATGDFDGDTEMETLVDDFAVLTKNGNLKLVYHLNGKNK